MAHIKEQVVLITGCSSGIGRALALQMAEKGHMVCASARKLASIQDLESDKISIYRLDVTDSASVTEAVNDIMAKHSRIDMLINNAGFGLIGPMAEIPLDKLRLQFETNVMGPVALIQAVVPHMAQRKSGRIVNMGSVSGITATPYAGPYCSSKAALHLLSDALRMELAPFGIEVIQLQPGGISSKFGETADATIDETYDRESSLYRKGVLGMKRRARMSQGSPTSVEEFAAGAIEAITRQNPPAVFRSGHGSFLLPFMKRNLPDGRIDKIMSKRFLLDDLKD